MKTEYNFIVKTICKMEHLDETLLGNMISEALNEDSILCEMAEIGKVDKFIVFIWSRDGGEIPHFHVGDAATYPKCTQFSTAIKIETAEYFPHGGKYTDNLNSKQKKKLNNFLKEIDDDETNWKYLVRTWNKNNSNHKLNINTPQPDYITLP